MAQPSQPKIAYFVWHTDRTGSNTLCDTLNQAGLGIVDTWSCGFYLGHGKHIKEHYPQSLVDYVKLHTSSNGVFGAKAGISYFDQIRKELGEDEIYEVTGFLTHHIILERKNKVEQAISALFAGATKRWHSKSEGYHKNLEVPYNRNKINWLMQGYVGEHARIKTFLGVQGFEPLQLYYEDYTQDFTGTAYKVADFLGVDIRLIRDIEPIFTKLENPLKREYYERYMNHE